MLAAGGSLRYDGRSSAALDCPTEHSNALPSLVCPHLSELSEHNPLSASTPDASGTDCSPHCDTVLTSMVFEMTVNNDDTLSAGRQTRGGILAAPSVTAVVSLVFVSSRSISKCTSNGEMNGSRRRAADDEIDDNDETLVVAETVTVVAEH